MPQLIENIKNANLGWQFYKYYYQDSQESGSIDDKNLTILSREFTNVDDFFNIDIQHSFELKVNYPGLLTGSGYTHEYIGDDKDGAFKIGFFFDHVTGMPYITGHGIKGVIRNAFPNHNKDRYKSQKASVIVDFLRKRKINVEDAFNTYLSKQGVHGAEFSEMNFAHLLGEIIFEGNQPIALKRDEFVFSQLPLAQKDIFFDCYISEAAENNLFLADDYITPHIPNPLKNPKPIKFLKIRPGVSFRFQFDLKDNLITSKQKEVLFKDIIHTFGIGAKTNVGYGQFSVNKKDDDEIDLPPIVKPESFFHPGAIAYLKKGKEFEGTVTSLIEGYYLISFSVNNKECQYVKRQTEKLPLEIDEKVKVICANDYLETNPNISIKKNHK